MHLWLKYPGTVMLLSLTPAKCLLKLSVSVHYCKPRLWGCYFDLTRALWCLSLGMRKLLHIPQFTVCCGELCSSPCVDCRYDAAWILWDFCRFPSNIAPTPWCEVPADFHPPYIPCGASWSQVLWGWGWPRPHHHLTPFPTALPFAGCRQAPAFCFWTLIPLASKWTFNYLESDVPLHYRGCIYP